MGDKGSVSFGGKLRDDSTHNTSATAAAMYA